MIYANNKLYTFSIFFLLLIGTNLLVAEVTDNSPLIARVGEDSITVEQFVGLFELNPRINSSNSSGLIAAKIDFLHTLIGNKIWYQYRKNRGVDTTLAERTAGNELRMMFTLDYLYRKKILEKTEPTEEELKSAFRQASKTLSVNYLFTESEDEINNLYDLLKQGFEFEEILAARNEREKQRESIKINFGDYEKHAEDELYSLDAKNYSNPIHLEDGYYIFYLANIFTKHFLDDESYQEENERIKDILRKRNENKIYNDFMKSVLSGKEVAVNKSLKEDLIKQFDKRKQNNLFEEIIGDSIYILSSKNVLEIESDLGKPVLNDVLLKIDSMEITFRKFIRALVLTHSKIIFNQNSSRKFVETKLSDYIQKLILYEEAKKMGFNTAGEVQSNLKLWTEYFSFESVRSSIADTINITDEMIIKAGRKIFQNSSDSTFIKDKSQMELIRNQLVDKGVSRILKYETAELAKNVMIEINYGLLQGLETSRIISFAIRRLGFGGSLPAVPNYFPNSGWVNPDNYKQYILP
ncbi:MAG: hypothetical protein PVH88_18840 [Ignavibacteria bacterium]|jgi:hypothetical protein